VAADCLDSAQSGCPAEAGFAEGFDAVAWLSAWLSGGVEAFPRADGHVLLAL